MNIHLAVALNGAGWHPAGWREIDARPKELFQAGYWTDLVRRAESAAIDFVTFEDALALQSSHRHRPDDRTDQVRGLLDAVLVAARVAPLTGSIGLVPSVTVTHTEPFHISKAIATLDYVSEGRAGVRVQVSGRAHEARHFGRRSFPPDLLAGPPYAGADELLDEAADYVEVIRRLWDSWEDNAEIRDSATGRFVDRDKLHYIDFEGRWFKVKGPSITPRPPQGQPLVTALAHVTSAYRLAARSADVVFVTPRDRVTAAATIGEIRDLEAVERPPSLAALEIFADLVVFLESTEEGAIRRRDRLDERAGAPYRSDASIFTGTPEQLADLLGEWAGAGLAGFRLRPGTLPRDLEIIADGVVPILRHRGQFRHGYEETTLRPRLGLTRPDNRYALGGSGARR